MLCCVVACCILHVRNVTVRVGWAGEVQAQDFRMGHPMEPVGDHMDYVNGKAHIISYGKAHAVVASILSHGLSRGVSHGIYHNMFHGRAHEISHG